MIRNLSLRFLASSPRCVFAVIAVAAIVTLLSANVSAARPETPETFPSPEQAVRALYLAARTNDQNALLRILGSEKEVASSADPIADQAERERFVRKYQEMHRLARALDGTEALHIGAENWPFPFPLVSENGAWHFDVDAGMQEVVLRRIGEDELAVIETCGTLAAAPHHSVRGSSGQPGDALMDNVGNANRPPFHGYYFRRVTLASRSAANHTTKQKSLATKNGFMYVAYPAEYRVTGVMTFAVGPDGVIYEIDLGPNTVAMAKKVNRLDSSQDWHVVEAH